MTARALLSDLPAYTALKEHAVKLQYASLEGLFNADSNRADTFTASAAGLHLDYSKHLLSSSALASLLDLAEQAGVQHGIEALFTGAHVNNTEDRPALHTLLRASSGGGQEDRFLEVQRARERMQVMAQKLYRGEHTGYSGKTITDVINIGIGGSDLGPRLVTQALKPFQGTVQCHYVSNVDPADLLDTLANLDAASTAFIICSKSFRTEETLANGLAARNWMLNAGATTAQLDKHFLAVTTNLQAALGRQDELINGLVTKYIPSIREQRQIQQTQKDLAGGEKATQS